MLRIILQIVFVISILTMNCDYASGQNFTENELAGKWTVINVIATKSIKSKDVDTKKQIALFKKSTFRFDLNKTFVYSIENKSDDPEIDKMEIYGAHWKLDSSSGIVVIEDWKEKDTDKYDLMEIKIKMEGDKIYFLISDTIFKLEVEKF